MENIPENLTGNKTAIEIRVRNVTIKGGREANEWGGARKKKRKKR